MLKKTIFFCCHLFLLTFVLVKIKKAGFNMVLSGYDSPVNLFFF